MSAVEETLGDHPAGRITAVRGRSSSVLGYVTERHHQNRVDKVSRAAWVGVPVQRRHVQVTSTKTSMAVWLRIVDVDKHYSRPCLPLYMHAFTLNPLNLRLFFKITAKCDLKTQETRGRKCCVLSNPLFANLGPCPRPVQAHSVYHSCMPMHTRTPHVAAAQLAAPHNFPSSFLHPITLHSS